MSTRLLPPQPSLENLKNQAKTLLKAYRAADPDAYARFRAALPRLSSLSDEELSKTDPSLRDAQQVVAREYGFVDWRSLKQNLETREGIPMLEMTVDRVKVNANNLQRVVVLKAKGTNRLLPIWIGPAEANSIAMHLSGKSAPRPMTHDLLDSIVVDLGAKVLRVVVSEIKDGTFYAKVIMQRNGDTIERDSRPSDAIALAVRTSAPIFAEEAVVERAGIDFDPEKADLDAVEFRWESGKVVWTEWEAGRFSIEHLDKHLSEQGKRVMAEACNEAERNRRNIQPEDLLLAILRLDETEAVAAKVLVNLGVDLKATADEVAATLSPGNLPEDAKVGYTKEAVRVLKLARSEALTLWHPSIDSEHILLALLFDDESEVGAMLDRRGVQHDPARAEVMNVLARWKTG